MWTRTLIRLLQKIIAPMILLVPTLYATARNLDRLPWGLDPWFGCREDGWNGTGCDPDFKRQYWRNVDGKTVQGWWPDYLGVIWDDLPFIKRWWYGFRWCAWRNTGWNLRLTSWFATSIHFNDIRVAVFDVNGNEKTIIWYNKFNSKEYYLKRRKWCGIWWEYGWEFYAPLFDTTSSEYNRIKARGYTYDVWPFKDRSIPSIRPRFKIKE